MLKRIVGKIFLVYAVLIAVVISLALSSNNSAEVFAISKTDCGRASENGEFTKNGTDVSDAVKWACDKISGGSTSRWGVVWFNSVYSTDRDKQDYVVKSEFSEADRSNDDTKLKITAWLHGQFYSGSNGGRKRDGMNAWAIRFVEPENYKDADEEDAVDVFYYYKYHSDGSKTCERYESKYDDKTYCHPEDTIDFLNNFDKDTVLVRGDSDPNTNKACSNSDTAKNCIENDTWSKSGEPLRLDIDTELMKSKNNEEICKYDETTNTYTCTVGMYRCPHTSITSDGHAAASSTCGTDNGKIIITEYGQTLGRMKLKAGPVGDDDPSNVAAVSYNGEYVDYGYTDYNATASFNAVNQIGAIPVIVPTASVKVKLGADQKIKFNFHQLLYRTLPSVKGEYATCYVYADSTDQKNCVTATANTNLKPSNTFDGKEVEKLKVYGKTDTAGNVRFALEGDVEVPSRNNEFCYALFYKNKDADRSVTQGRAICVKIEVTEIPPKVEGRIAFNAASASVSNGAVDGATAIASALLTAAGTKVTSWSSDGNPSGDTKTLSRVTLEAGVSTDVYAHWRFDVRSDKANGNYQTRLIECRSKSDACVDWIKDVDIIKYKDQPNDAKAQDSDGNDIDGTKVYKTKRTGQNLSSDYTDDDGHTVNTVKNASTPQDYEDKLKGESKYTICYKFFVAENSAHISENDKDLWNVSVACVKASSGPAGKPQGEVKMVFNSSSYSGCSVQQNNAASTNADISGSTTVKREISDSDTYKNSPTFVDIKCGSNSADSVKVTFSHEIYSDSSLPKKSVQYQAKHIENATQQVASDYNNMKDRNVFYNEMLPTSAGKINRGDIPTLKSKKTSNNPEKYENGGTGQYTLNDGDDYTCEGLFANDNNNAVICVKMAKDGGGVPGDLSGYSKVEITSGADTCDMSSATVNTVSGRPETTITCSGPVTAKFTHYSTSDGNQLGTRTLHRTYYNPNAGNSTVEPFHKHYFAVGWNSTETIANSRSVSANMTCESQWYGSDSNAKTSKVCVQIATGTCDILNSTPFGKASGTSAIATGVMNMTIANGTWGTEIIAKPTDQIQFKHCYFTGAQATKTTKYWDILNSNEHKPSFPSYEDGCDEQEYNEGESMPSGCSPAPSYSLLPKSSSCTSGDWSNCDGENYSGYTVDTDELETLNEATYLKNKSEDNKYLNTYDIETFYPGSHGLGNGTSNSRTSSQIAGYSSIIGMKYSGKSSEPGKDAGFNNSTVGNPGVVGFGIAENENDVFITIGAPGGTLSQSISAYTGTVARKKHDQTWKFYIGYQYPICEYEKEDDGFAETCTKDTGTVSSTNTSKRGKGSGDHGSIYYERDDDATNYDYETKTASVYVQYNYQNTAKVEIDPTTKIYAGESFRLKNAFVYVNPIYNGLTKGTYATIAPDINVQLYAYISDTDQSERAEARTSAGTTRHTSLNGCDYYLNGTGLACETIDYNYSKTFNTQGKYGGTNNEYKEKAFPTSSYNAFDYIAGRYLCVGLGMNKSQTHAVSYGDRGTEVEESNIYYSQPSCAIIYKKPTFAVWGSSLFSNGDIRANILDKRNVANYTPYQNTGTAYRISFSSWVEGLVVGNGDIRGLASGAATGYTFAGDASNNYAPVAAPGGIDTGDYCILSALTVANESCSSNISGNAEVGLTGAKDAIARKYINPYYNLETNTVKRTQCGANGRSICRIANSTLGSIEVSYGDLLVYATNGNVTIDENIIIPETYISANQIPQVIIYAEGDINIAGGVTRLDAILVSGGKINTCAEYNTVKDSSQEYVCHQQLRINGAVIADTIELNRLYGASVGSYSVEPAEIINQSPAMIIHGMEQDSKDINEDLAEVYTRELAPRQ